MSEIEFNYDVSFTLIEKDLKLAKEIISKLNKDIDIFLYEEKQKELVGENGIIFFHNVFEKESRLVVVLHRKEWGNTPWTRVEEDAMINRYLSEGEDFILLISLDDPKDIPNWVPRKKIYYDLKRFGIDGVAAIIEERVKNRGKELTNLTLEDKLKRISEEQEIKMKIFKLLNASDGKALDLANKEYDILTKKLEQKIMELNKTNSSIKFAIEREGKVLNVNVSGYILIFEWWPQCSNSLTGAFMIVTIRKIKIERDYWKKEFSTLAQNEYLFNIDTNWINGWTIKSNNEFYTSDNLIDKWLRILLKYMEDDITKIKTYNQ